MTPQEAFAAAFTGLAVTTAQHHQERAARQSDATQIDNRGLNAAVLKAITESDLAEVVAGMNTGSHAPIPQPWMVPPWVAQKP